MLETCKQTEPLQLQSKVDGWSLVRKEAFVLLMCGDRDKLEKPCIAHVVQEITAVVLYLTSCEKDASFSDFGEIRSKHLWWMAQVTKTTGYLTKDSGQRVWLIFTMGKDALVQRWRR